MYWIRTADPWQIAPLLLLCGLWWSGSWLLVTHLFRLPSRERLLASLGAGLLWFITLSNLLANLIPLLYAYWLAAGLIFLAGLLSGYRSHRKPLLSWRDWNAWPQLAVLAGLTLFFTLIGRGLSIFDDYHNLPLVSVMAAGDVPPHFYLDAQQPLAYHYGLHLFAASLVRVGDFFVWSAFDLSKAFSIALTVLLGWLWFRRVTRDSLAASAGGLLVLLGGGARWLLLLAPSSLLLLASANIHLIGSGAASGKDLFQALGSAWNIEGGPPFAFPFAFANGIFPPAVLSLGGPGSLPLASILVLLLLARKRWTPVSGLFYGLLLASLALSADHLFPLVWVGIALAALAGWLASDRTRRFLSWIWPLAPAALLAMLAGGTLSVVVKDWIVRHMTGSQPVQAAGFTGFALRWPPALLSAHLGELSPFQPLQLLAALLEIGPVLLLGPFAVWWGWRRWRGGDPLVGGFSAAALLSFLIPIFVRYQAHDRDMTRFFFSALSIWMVLGFPWLVRLWRRGANWLRSLISTWYAVAVLGGLVLLSIQMTAIAHPQYAYFIQKSDAIFAQKYWNRLPAGSYVLDPTLFRAPTVFGRHAGRAALDIYYAFPETGQLLDDMNPAEIARAGYRYLYLDQDASAKLTQEQLDDLHAQCVQEMDEALVSDTDQRWLLDVSACQ